jgi:RimJ/RimL family protein N-acetyltransferase
MPMHLTVIELTELHLAQLYETSADGLLVRPRNYARPAPRFSLMRTVEGNRWLISAAIPKEERAELNAALAIEPVITSNEALEVTPPRIACGARGPAFYFPERIPDLDGPVEILADPRETPTVPELAWLRDAKRHEQPLAVARNEAGEVVSICHSSRSTPAGTEAGLETAADYRQRGFGAAVVALWAAAVRAEGRLPLYSTEWSNEASRGVARKLGLIMYGEDCRGPL